MKTIRILQHLYGDQRRRDGGALLMAGESEVLFSPKLPKISLGQEHRSLNGSWCPTVLENIFPPFWKFVNFLTTCMVEWSSCTEIGLFVMQRSCSRWSVFLVQLTRAALRLVFKSPMYHKHRGSLGLGQLGKADFSLEVVMSMHSSLITYVFLLR